MSHGCSDIAVTEAWMLIGGVHVLNRESQLRLPCWIVWRWTVQLIGNLRKFSVCGTIKVLGTQLFEYLKVSECPTRKRMQFSGMFISFAGLIFQCQVPWKLISMLVEQRDSFFGRCLSARSCCSLNSIRRKQRAQSTAFNRAHEVELVKSQCKNWQHARYMAEYDLYFSLKNRLNHLNH